MGASIPTEVPMEVLLSYFGALDEEARAFATTAARVVLILLIAWLLQAVARRLIRAFRVYMARRAAGPDEAPRIETLGRVFRYTATVVIAIVAGTLVLGELGVSVAPILATAGVAGVAIGFGAQSLIKDYFNGFFLLLEDQGRLGHVIDAARQGGRAAAGCAPVRPGARGSPATPRSSASSAGTTRR